VTIYSDYIKKMIEDGRLITIKKEGKVILMLFYSVCNNPKKYLDNLDHKYISHDTQGKTIVIEEMLCNHFDISLVSILEREFSNRYPNFEQAVWRRNRKPKDKIFIQRRRRHYEIIN
jgi:hypothetical protein